MLKIEDILDTLNGLGVTKEQFAMFFGRAMLLTQRDQIDSAIARERAAQATDSQAHEDKINELTQQRQALQQQIDAL